MINNNDNNESQLLIEYNSEIPCENFSDHIAFTKYSLSSIVNAGAIKKWNFFKELFQFYSEIFNLYFIT